MFKTIVCPVGIEEKSFYAVPTAVEMAEKFGAKLILLHLDDTFLDVDERMMLRVSVRAAKKEIEEKALTMHKKIEAICQKNGWLDKINKIELREGHPGSHLPHLAETLGAELIVIYTTARQDFLEKVIGSTADSIIHHAKIPVLVLHRK